MGGAAPAPSGKGGKKPLDASINLVPFIDLLSCCISFLLITAVWTQFARMNVTQKGQGQAGRTDVDKPPEPTVSLTLFIDKDGYTFSKSTGDSTPIPMQGEEYDIAKLTDTLRQTKGQYPDKTDITVKADDAVIYNKIIQTMDAVIGAGFPDVSLSDKGGGG